MEYVIYGSAIDNLDSVVYQSGIDNFCAVRIHKQKNSLFSPP
jgi:hypothetical protein